MAEDNGKRQALYNALKSRYDLGTYEEYDAKMNDESKRKALYNAISNTFDVGAWDDFNEKTKPVEGVLGGGNSQQSIKGVPQEAPAPNPNDVLATDTVEVPAKNEGALMRKEGGMISSAVNVARTAPQNAPNKPLMPWEDMKNNAEDWAQGRIDAIRAEQARKNAPVYEGVPETVGITQGQWENAVDNQVKATAKELTQGKADEVMKRADEAFAKTLGELTKGNGILDYVNRDTEGATRMHNVKVANENMMKAVNDYSKNYVNGIAEELNRENLAERIKRESTSLGMTEENYAKYLAEKMANEFVTSLHDKQVARYMPEGSMDYILSGVTNSIFGMISRAVMEAPEQAALRDEANARYAEDASLGEKIGSMAVSFIADAPFFGMTGKLSAATVRSIAESQIEKMMARGVSRGAAQRAIGAAMRNSFGMRAADAILKGSVGGAVNLGAYNVIQETTNEAAHGEFKPSQILGKGFKGLATGAALGVSGGLIGSATAELSGIPKFMAEIGGFGAEATVFAGMDRMMEGDNGMSWTEQLAESALNLAVMKATQPGGWAKAYKTITNFREAMKPNGETMSDVKFTPSEIEEIKRSTGASDLLDALSRMEAVNSRERARGGDMGDTRVRRYDGKEIADAQTQVERAYEDFMNDKEVTYMVKQKVARLMGGKMSLYVPYITGYDTRQEGDVFTVTTRDKDGNAIDRKVLNSEAEFNAYTEQLQKAMANDVAERDQSVPTIIRDEMIAEQKTDSEKRRMADDLERFIKDGTVGWTDEKGRPLEAKPEIVTAEMEARRQKRDKEIATKLRYKMSEYAESNNERGLTKYQGDKTNTSASGVNPIDGNKPVENIPAEGNIGAENIPAEGVGVAPIGDDIIMQVAEYGSQIENELSPLASEGGKLVKLTLDNGENVYYKNGQLDNKFGSVNVVTPEGEPIQIATNRVRSVQDTAVTDIDDMAQFIASAESVDDVIGNKMAEFERSIRERMTNAENGTDFYEGDVVSLMVEGAPRESVVIGKDEANNVVFADAETGLNFVMPLEDATAAFAEGKASKEAVVKKEAMFANGIVGYAEGQADLFAPGTEAKTAAEYLSQGEDRAKQMKVITDELDMQNTRLEQAKKELQKEETWMETRGDMLDPNNPRDSESLAEVQSVINGIRGRIESINARRQKAIDVREAFMNDEEREALKVEHKTRAEAAKTKIGKDKGEVQLNADIAEAARVPSEEEIANLGNDASNALRGKRKALAEYMDNVLAPKQKKSEALLGDYLEGKADLSYDELLQVQSGIAAIDKEARALNDAMRALKGAEAVAQKASTENVKATPAEERVSYLSKAKSTKDLEQRAKKTYGEYLGELGPQTLEEYVAVALRPHSINYDGVVRDGEIVKRGLKQELGGLTRGAFGRKGDLKAIEYFVAKSGEGLSVDEVAHGVWQDFNDSMREKYDVQDVKDAALDMLASAENASDISRMVLNNRIADAEERMRYDEEKQGEFEAMEQERLAEEEGFWQYTEMILAENPLTKEDIQKINGIFADVYMAEDEACSIAIAKAKLIKTEEDYDNGRILPEVSRNESSRGVDKNTKGGQIHQGSGEGQAYVRGEEPYLGQAQARSIEQNGHDAGSEKSALGDNVSDGELHLQNEVLKGNSGVNENEHDKATVGQNNDEQREEDSRGVAQGGSASAIPSTGRRGDIRVFEEGLVSKLSDDLRDSERARRRAESERLVEVAKATGQYLSKEEVKSLGDKYPKRTGESVVYIDEENGVVYKVKDPFAKSAMKKGVEPEDVVYEHQLHNALFPETEYIFEGITDENGDVRVVLSQKRSLSFVEPTKEQIAEALAKKGLFPEDKYSFGNDLVSVTDVEGDNVLVGKNGEILFIDPIISVKKPIKEVLDALKTGSQPIGDTSSPEKIAAQRAAVNANPSEAQKRAGNYAMGHIKVDGFDISIENPKGSVRSGRDDDGTEWSIEMKHDYGYIKGTRGVDGDHIDIYLSDNPASGKVFVVDQVNQKDGSFDEHKVMYGFNSMEEAVQAYRDQYEDGWKVGKVTEVSREEFKKWVESSTRKTKSFAEYASVKADDVKEAERPQPKNVDELLAEADRRKGLARKQSEDAMVDKAVEDYKQGFADILSKLSGAEISKGDVTLVVTKEGGDMELSSMAEEALGKAVAKMTADEREAFRDEMKALMGRTITPVEELLKERAGEEGFVAEELTQMDMFSTEYANLVHAGNLPKLEEGELSLIERQFTENGYFGFSGGKVESADDVAYVLRNLEDKAVENAFAVLVTGDRPTIIHLGMGAFDMTIVNAGAVKAAVDDFGAEKIFFVHNHPSGNLKPSRPDYTIANTLREMYPDKMQDSIIIDTTSGQYATFDERTQTSSVKDRNTEAKGEESTYVVKTFDKQVFAEDYDVKNMEKMNSPELIAAFVSSQRLGDRGKVGVLVLNNNAQIVGNFHVPFKDLSSDVEGLADEMARLGIRHGGRSVIPYGNFKLSNKESAPLGRAVKRLSGGAITVTDIISNAKNAWDYASAIERGYSVGEAEAEYTRPVQFSIREEEAPKKTEIGYKVFVLKNNNLYPPMVANPNGEATPVRVWLNADAAPVAGQSKTGRPQVKAGGKGTQGGSGKLAYRPGWHLGEIPYAKQFSRLNPETGEKDLFPKNFVWAEVEYSADNDYQEEANAEGLNENGKFVHSLAGMKRLPKDGYYKYRTNPDPTTDPWIITGAMRVNRILKPSEVDDMVAKAGREPQQREMGAISDADIDALNEKIKTEAIQKENVEAERRRVLGEAAIDLIKHAGIEVSTDVKEMAEVLGEGAQMQARLNNLAKAAKAIKDWFTNKKEGKTFELELPKATLDYVKKAIRRANYQKEIPLDGLKFRLTSDGLKHGKKNHGVNGKKIESNNIPLRDEDFELAPYIMTRPDNVEIVTSWENNPNRLPSILFKKTLSNGVVVVVERQIGNDPHIAETTNMWADLSSTNVPDARFKRPLSHVQNVTISTEDATKIRKDAENAIARDGILQQLTVFHGSGADFDAFDHSHMGEGEGNQSFGWGTYVTDVKGVAKGYAISQEERSDRLSILAKEKWIKERKQAIKAKGDYEKYAKEIEKNIKRLEKEYKAAKKSGDEADIKFYEELIEVAKSGLDRNKHRDLLNSFQQDINKAMSDIDGLKAKHEGKHNLYKVKIPNDTGENYLSWEGALTEKQFEAIENAVEGELGIKHEVVANGNHRFEVGDEYFWLYPNGDNGKDLYLELVNMFDSLGSKGMEPARKASELLSSAGLVGIKYSTNYFRGGNEDGKKNYVIFNEADAKITNKTQFLRTSKGEVYGFVKDGKMYLDPNLLNPNTPIHEYNHLWDNALMENNPELWKHGVDLLKQTALWDEVVKDKAYADIKDNEDLVASEVKSRLTGKRGEEILEKMYEEAKAEEDGFKKVEKLGLVAKLRAWIKETWQWVKDTMTPWTKEEAAKVSLDDFINMTLKDFVQGKKLPKTKGYGVQKQTEVTPHNFNEKVVEMAEKHGIERDVMNILADALVNNEVKDGHVMERLQKAEQALRWMHDDMLAKATPEELARDDNNPFRPTVFSRKRGMVMNDIEAVFGRMDVLRNNAYAEESEREFKKAQEEQNKTEEAKPESRANILADDHNFEWDEKAGRYKVSKAGDKAYKEAVKRGDMDMAQEMVNKAALAAGYTSGDDFRMMHTAPTNDGFAKSVKNIAEGDDMVPGDYWEHPEWYGNDEGASAESFRKIRSAIDMAKDTGRGKIWMYRAVPKDLKEDNFRNGDWITPSREYATEHGESNIGGKYKIISEHVRVDQIWWNGDDINEWGYDDGNAYAYADTKNNRKLLDAVTYDGFKQMVPLSKRFGKRNSNIRFRFIGERGAAKADAKEQATRRMDSLMVARELEKDKKSARSIKWATGWERGADGKWRYEEGDEVKGAVTRAIQKRSKDMKAVEEYVDLLKKQLDEGWEKFVTYYDEHPEQSAEEKEKATNALIAKMEDLNSKRSDALVALNPKEGYVYTLGEVMPKDSELFKAYSDMARTQLRIIDDPSVRSNGGYNLDGDEIIVNISGRNSGELFDMDVSETLAHEIQHAIQHREGFAEGGSPSTVRVRLQKAIAERAEDVDWAQGRLDALADINKALLNLEISAQYLRNPKAFLKSMEHFKYSGTKEELLKKGQELAIQRYWDVMNEDWGALYGTVYGMHRLYDVRDHYGDERGVMPGNAPHQQLGVEEMVSDLRKLRSAIRADLKDSDARVTVEEFDKLQKAVKTQTDYELYKRLAGEVEARRVAARVEMSDEERREKLITDTEDVATEDQIFLFDGMLSDSEVNAKMTFSNSVEEFKQRQAQAVRENGIVSPNLHTKEVKVTDVKNHDIEYTDANDARQKAKDWVKKNPIHGEIADDRGNKIPYTVAPGSVNEFLTDKNLAKTIGIDGQLSVLQSLPSVLGNCIEVETHPDIKKVNGERDGSSVNAEVLMHTYYGAVKINGEVHPIKLRIKEFIDHNKSVKPYVYEVEKINLNDVLHTSGQESHAYSSSSRFISAAKLLEKVYKNAGSSENIVEISKKNAENEEIARKEAVESAIAFGEQLGGVGVTRHDTLEDAPSEVQKAAKKGVVKGWYDPSDGSVHLHMPAITSADDAARTVFHEKLGHEGLKALLGSDEAVMKWGQFIFDSASKDIRKSIVERADAEGYDWTDHERFAKAAQEVFADIAAEGPHTAEEFSLWRKVKHYIIKALKAMGIKVKGLVNDHDLRYYVMKTAEALGKNKREYSSEDMTQASVMFSREKMPKFGDVENETRSEYYARLREWKDRKDEQDRLKQVIDGSEAKTRKIGVNTAIIEGQIAYSNVHVEDMVAKKMAMSAIYKDLKEVAKALADSKVLDIAEGLIMADVKDAVKTQKVYDRASVKSVVDMARMLLRNNMLDQLSKGEVSRLLTLMKDANGKMNASKEVDGIMDLMVGNVLRRANADLEKSMKTKETKVDNNGVEVQGKLDLQGQQAIKAMRDYMNKPVAEIDARINELLALMEGDDEALASKAYAEYQGLKYAKEYAANILDSELEEIRLDEGVESAIKEFDDYRKKTVDNLKVINDNIARLDNEEHLTTDAKKLQEIEESRKAWHAKKREENRKLKERRQALADLKEHSISAKRENLLNRAEAFQNLAERVAESISLSRDAAKAFRDKEIFHAKEIHADALKDLDGVPDAEHRKDSLAQKFANSSIPRFFASSLANFDQVLRMLGSKTADGEGYLWRRFMTQWTDATDNEWEGIKEANKALDAKVSEVMGKNMHWSDLYSASSKSSNIEVEFWNGSELQTMRLTQGNALYIYMANKMADGAMKLRWMGIREEEVERIKDELDPRFVELADWVQSEFLPMLRNKYNRTHEEMFGASMASVDNYFPLRILSNARHQSKDIGMTDVDGETPSTITGSLIKRTKNYLPLDVLNTDAFSLVIEHVEQMEHWNAFAGLNKDLNSLMNYNPFRNRVQNMTSVYGGGKQLLKVIEDTMRIAVGTYETATAKKGAADKAALNIAKGVTGAKVSFRLFTAFKQLTSWPAFLAKTDIATLAKSFANPKESWDWAIENMPLFDKRWSSRQAGNEKLKDTADDWMFWRNNIVKKASRWGMTPNAFVDAVTVACGGHAVYKNMLAEYLKQGYAKQQAEKKAKLDASVVANESQQSSEGAYLSPIQSDRTWFSTGFTIFRNSPMGYTRSFFDNARNFERMSLPEGKEKMIGNMAKQMEREGVWADIGDKGERDAKIRESAESRFKKAYNRSLAGMAVFGWLVQFAWNMGPALIYDLLGDDNDEKLQIMKEHAMHALFGPLEGLVAGQQMSDFFNALLQGQGFMEASEGAVMEMPLTGDLMMALGHFQNSDVQGVWDLINLAVQSGIGASPQILTDAIVAVLDACKGDLGVAKEATLLFARIAQVPQSQLDKVYLDEIVLSADKAKNLTIKQLAQRYARYKRLRETGLLGWMEEEANDAALAKKEERFMQLAKERVMRLGDKEVNADYEAIMAIVSENSKKAKAYKDLAQSSPEKYAAKMASYDTVSDAIATKYDHLVDAKVKELLSATDSESWDKILKEISTLKADAVKKYNGETSDSYGEGITPKNANDAFFLLANPSDIEKEKLLAKRKKEAKEREDEDALEDYKDITSEINYEKKNLLIVGNNNAESLRIIREELEKVR